MADPGKSFKLFGYPIAHSLAPTLHNAVFSSQGNQNTFSLYSTSKITQDMINFIRSDECGGGAITMPNKTAIIPYLDELTPEARSTDAVNTIVKVPFPSSSGGGGYKLVGTNTDILGIKNALLRALQAQYPDAPFARNARFAKEVGGAGVVIGGGATTRSAVHALWMMGLEKVYLVNRDVGEVDAGKFYLSIHIKLT